MAKKPPPASTAGPSRPKITFAAIRTKPKIGLGPFAITANGVLGIVGLDQDDVDKMLSNLERGGAAVEYNDIYRTKNDTSDDE